MNMASKKILRGASIIELLAAMAILSLITIMVVSVYFTHFKIFSNQSESIQIANQNKISLDEITNQIRESQSVATTCANCGGDSSGTAKIVLQLWPLDASGNPKDPGGSKYDYIVYKRDDLENSKLIKKIIPDPSSTRSASTKIIATEVNNLQFAYDVAPPATTQVTITLTNTSKSLNKTNTITQESKAVLRNK